jgi:hypothetical protein
MMEVYLTTSKDALQSIIASSGLTYEKLAAITGKTAQGVHNNTIRDTRISSFTELANACDYDVILKPRKRGGQRYTISPPSVTKSGSRNTKGDPAADRPTSDKLGDQDDQRKIE